MNTIIINGVKIQTDGKSISIQGDKVFVDGKVVKDGLSGIVKVEFKGDLASLQSDSSVVVHGNVQGDVDAGGSIECGDVGGSVDAGGSVRSSKVGGNIDAGGSVSIR